MLTKIELKSTKLPKLLSDLSHSNQFLKMFSTSLLGITLSAVIVISVLATRDPVVLTLTPDAEIFKKSDMPELKDEIRAAMTRYIDLRYKWSPGNVKQHMAAAEAFVHPTALKAYQSATSNVVRFSTEKQVAQRAYVVALEPNSEKKIVSVSGDRITSIQGLKAAGDLKLELSFETGPRTENNPWGIYVTKEKEL